MIPSTVRTVLSMAFAAAVLASGCDRTAAPDAAPAAATAPSAPAAAPAAPAANPAVAVTGIELGNRLGDDQRIAMPGAMFRPTDSIHAVVATGAASRPATLQAKWSYLGGPAPQVVHVEEQAVAAGAPAMHGFSIANPGGWPPGRYRIEVSVDGQPAQSRDFVVQ